MHAFYKLSYISAFVFVFGFVQISKAEPDAYACFRTDESVRSVFFQFGKVVTAPDGSDVEQETQRIQFDVDSIASVVVKRVGDSSTLTLEVGGLSQAWGLQNGERLYLVRCLAARLNRDDHADLVVELSAEGNGLAAELSTIVLILSHENEYIAVATETYQFAPQNLVMVEPDAGVQWIQTSFAQANGRDGKGHSFWVHRLWAIMPDSLELNATFTPRIVQYTHRPNQSETSLLSEKAKRTMLSELPTKSIRLAPLP
jgi:hypothetical protein